MKKILFINLYFEIGGVETLLLRVIRELNRQGFKSTVLLLRKKYDDSLFSQLKEIADVVFLSDLRLYSPEKFRAAVGRDFGHIFVTINDALLLGAILQRWVYPNAHLVAGVYQTEVFCAPVTWRYLHRKVINDLFCYCVPDKNKIIANEAGRNYHQNKLNYDLSEAKIVPLIVDVEQYLPVERNHVRREKVVSVGRLVDFKTYNITFFNVLLELNAQGLFLEWHVYGDGPLEESMRDLIEQHQLHKQVFLHGILDYKDFKSVVSDAFVFIGSGTAIIEAAACGVPVIPAIEYADQAISYGFFHEIDGISFFEPNMLYPTLNISTLILYLTSLEQVKYKVLSEKNIEKAMLFSCSSVSSLYLNAFMGTESNKFKFPVSWFFEYSLRYLTSKVYALSKRLFL
ncbi:glycosyltransferase family 4 protein [Shewanella bicestrii]